MQLLGLSPLRGLYKSTIILQLQIVYEVSLEMRLNVRQSSCLYGSSKKTMKNLMYFLVAEQISTYQTVSGIYLMRLTSATGEY